MSALVSWVMRLLVILSLFSMPFSMSHAAMISSEASHSAHSAMMDDQHTAKSHSHDRSTHMMEVDDHEGLHGENCCSSICGGDILVDGSTPSTHFQPNRFTALNEKPRVSGEWVTPHRPPSI